MPLPVTAPIRLSLLLATAGRVELAVAVWAAAPQLAAGDELLIAGGGSWGAAVAHWAKARHLDLPPGGNWGHAERNAAMPEARGTHLLFLDDDDLLLPGALAAIRAAIAQAPDVPHVFRMIDPQGRILPERPGLRQGHIGTPCLVAPNVPARLGTWGARYEGDFDFIRSTLAHYPDGAVWHAQLIYGCRAYGRRLWGLPAESQ